MGLLDDLEHQIGSGILSKLTGQQQGGLLQSVAGLINNHGGLSGLTNQLTQNGLGQHVQSWISNNPNIPIEAEHVMQTFGTQKVQQIAQKLGIDPSHASAAIAQVLPQLIDKITPQGTQVSDAQAQSSIASIITRGITALFSK